MKHRLAELCQEVEFKDIAIIEIMTVLEATHGRLESVESTERETLDGTDESKQNEIKLVKLKC